MKQVINSNLLAIDVGVNYLGACASSFGDQFLLDGNRLKSWNFYYLKKVHDLECINPKSKRIIKYKKRCFNYLNQYIFKTICWLKRYCEENKIHTIVLGKMTLKRYDTINHFLEMEFDFGNVNVFVMSMFYYKLRTMAKKNNITIVDVDEEYSSKASFYDEEKMRHGCSNRRYQRGTFKTFDGHRVHADINACLNFFRKDNRCWKLVNKKVCKKNLLKHPKKIHFND